MNQIFKYELVIFIPCFGKDGMDYKFINMVQMLFNNVKTIVCFNGSKPFKIEQGIKQGCQLAPYLVILVKKVLNFMVKEVMKLGDVI